MVSLLVGALLCVVYVWYLSRISKKMSCKKATFPLRLWISIHSALFAILTLFSLTKIISTYLVTGESYVAVALILLGLTLYGTWSGLETIVRCMEPLFWFLLLPFLWALFFAAKGINVDNFICRESVIEIGGGAGIWAILRGSAFVFSTYSPLFYLMLFPTKSRGNRKYIAGGWALALSLVVLGASFVILLGNYGWKALGSMEHPIISIMSTIQITGGFLKRTDALMMAIWFISLLTEILIYSFYSEQMLYLAIKRKKVSKMIYFILCIGVLWLIYSPTAQELGSIFIHYIAGLFAWLLPLALLITNVMGCSAVELEKRYFPMALEVETNGELKASQREREENVGRTMDYNHLKVLYMKKDLLQNLEELGYVLEQLERNEELPRNTYLCLSDEPESLLENGEQVERILENDEKIKAEAFPTLGSLLAEKQNRDKQLLIPYISKKPGYPVISSYYSLIDFQEGKEISREEALLIFYEQDYIRK